MNKSNKVNITKNSLVNSFFTLIAQFFGFLRDILLAAILGTGIFSNIFVVALKIPFSFQRSFSGETFNSAFIPTLNSIRGVDEKINRIQLARSISLLSFLLLIPLVIIIEIKMPFVLSIIAPGFVDTPEFDLLLTSSRITFFYIIFIILSSVFVGLLNYKSKFSITASLPIVINLVFIFFIFYSSNLSYQDKVLTLSWALVIGGAFQLILLLISTNKDFWDLSINFRYVTSNTKKFFKLIFPTFLSASCLQINLLVGIFFASFYQGAISYIYFAERVYMLPVTLTGVSIATVLIPALSAQLKLNNIKEALAVQNKACRLSISLTLPAIAILMMLSYEIVQFLFERGEFSQVSTQNTSRVLQLFSLGIPMMCISLILRPYFFAKELPYIPLRITIVSVLFNVCLTVILFQYISFLSIPLSISISSVLTLYMYCVKHKENNFFTFSSEILKFTRKYFIFSLLLCLEILVLKNLLYYYGIDSTYILFIILAACLISYLAFIQIFDKDLSQDIKIFFYKENF